MHPVIQPENVLQTHRIVDPDFHVPMGDKRLKQFASVQVEQLIDAVDENPDLHAPLCRMIQRRDHIRPAVVRPQVKGGQNHRTLRAGDHPKPPEKSLFVVVNAQDALPARTFRLELHAGDFFRVIRIRPLPEKGFQDIHSHDKQQYNQQSP